MDLCAPILQLRLYSFVAGLGITLLLIFVVLWDHGDHVLISERQFDHDRSVETKGTHLFRIRFKYKNVPIVVSGFKAYPKKYRHKNKREHASSEEINSQLTRQGAPLAPFVLIQGDNDKSYSSHSWVTSGTMRLITGFNHDVYAVDMPGALSHI
ncbi:hypothetical protein Ciccas_012211 [Cichlidogyrus casuarinus]|uniref:Uncharacterized protein n=1 Tax=Cichlidogyrus casuarinus TaxID=1844966 RepID=A0ABD2PPI5_9PLAT